jgi:hypothetical protein
MTPTLADSGTGRGYRGRGHLTTATSIPSLVKMQQGKVSQGAAASKPRQPSFSAAVVLRVHRKLLTCPGPRRRLGPYRRAFTAVNCKLWAMNLLLVLCAQPFVVGWRVAAPPPEAVCELQSFPPRLQMCTAGTALPRLE